MSHDNEERPPINPATITEQIAKLLAHSRTVRQGEVTIEENVPYAQPVCYSTSHETNRK